MLKFVNNVLPYMQIAIDLYINLYHYLVVSLYIYQRSLIVYWCMHAAVSTSAFKGSKICI